MKSTEFAARLRAHRAALGITQAQAAAICGMSLRSWSTWEAGAGLPPFATLHGVLCILASAERENAAAGKAAQP